MTVLVAAGDVYLRRDDAESAFADIREHWADADAVFCNVESPLSHRGVPAPGRRWAMRADPQVAPALRKAGFTVVSVAHNHALDFGPDAYLDTVAALDEAGIACAGGGANMHAAAKEAVQILPDGRRLALWAVACSAPPAYAATEDRVGVARVAVETSYEADAEQMSEFPGYPFVVRTRLYPGSEGALCEALRRSEAEIRLVSVHWGLPFRTDLLDYQRELAHAVVDAGADAVLGHHTHTMQAVEVYREKPIFYGLGNFVFDLDYPGGFEEEQLLARLCIDGDQATKVRGSVCPILSPEGGRPVVATGERAARIHDRLEHLSAAFGTEIKPTAGSPWWDIHE